MNVKPEMTTKEKERCNEIYALLKSHGGYVTKEELCETLGWKWNSSSDRKIRDLISLIAYRFPIISTSDGKGYKLVGKVGVTEAKELLHQAKEHEARADKILARNEPIMRYLDKFMNANGIKTLVDLENKLIS